MAKNERKQKINILPPLKYCVGSPNGQTELHRSRFQVLSKATAYSEFGLVRDTSLVIQTRIFLKEQYRFVLWDSKPAMLKAHCNLYVMHMYAFGCICTFLI